mgnify:CR=1 FL=1
MDSTEGDVRMRYILAMRALRRREENWEKIGVGQASMTAKELNSA